MDANFSNHMKNLINRSRFSKPYDNDDIKNQSIKCDNVDFSSICKTYNLIYIDHTGEFKTTKTDVCETNNNNTNYIESISFEPAYFSSYIDKSKIESIETNIENNHRISSCDDTIINKYDTIHNKLIVNKSLDNKIIDKNEIIQIDKNRVDKSTDVIYDDKINKNTVEYTSSIDKSTDVIYDDKINKNTVEYTSSIDKSTDVIYDDKINKNTVEYTSSIDKSTDVIYDDKINKNTVEYTSSIDKSTDVIYDDKINKNTVENKQKLTSISEKMLKLISKKK